MQLSHKNIDIQHFLNNSDVINLSNHPAELFEPKDDYEVNESPMIGQKKSIPPMSIVSLEKKEAAQSQAMKLKSEFLKSTKKDGTY